MEKFYINQKSKVTGIYLINTRNIERFSSQRGWYSIEDMPFLPMLNFINIDPNGQVKFVSTRGEKDNIDTFNGKLSVQRFNDEVLENSMIDCTMNDLSDGVETATFNFTGTHLTITPFYGRPKLFHPLKQKKSIPGTEGKLVFVSIHTINTDTSVSHLYGVDNNYLEQMRDKYVGKKDYKSVEIKEIYDFIIAFLASKDGQSKTLIHDTYKVATMTIVDVNKIFELEDFTDKRKDTICINNLAKDITRLGPVEARMHDCFSENFVHDPKVMATIREHGVSCFIVDNEKKLSSRFYTFAGRVMEVPVMQDIHRVDGLYLMYADASKKVAPIQFTPIDEINSVKYIYDNREMAFKGSDMAALRKEEIEQLKADQAIEAMRESTAHAREMRDIKLKYQTDQQAASEDRARFEAVLSEQRITAELAATKARAEHDALILGLKTQLERKKQETDLFKYEFDQSRYRMDNNSMYMKQNYEEGRYQRDTTIETIKTAGAVAGLLAGGYVLYNKLR